MISKKFIKKHWLFVKKSGIVEVWKDEKRFADGDEDEQDFRL